jgi:hypothetical protein
MTTLDLLSHICLILGLTAFGVALLLTLMDLIDDGGWD